MSKIGYLLGTRICWKSPDLDHSLWHKWSKTFNTKLPLLRHLWFFWDGVLVYGMAPQQEETEQSMSGERVTMQLFLKGNFDGRFEHFSRQRLDFLIVILANAYPVFAQQQMSKIFAALIWTVFDLSFQCKSWFLESLLDFFYLHYNFDNRHDSWHLRWCKYTFIRTNIANKMVQDGARWCKMVPTMVYEGCVIGRLAFYSLSPFTFCNSRRPYFTMHILKPKYP